ncbi:MAG TPA: GtrA family protein [Pseudomonas sp.]|uniref:GtrA family protein n=1 Tax=Pseudomonas sp. TaxID=306 RepID=UPI00262368D1|nr:GtrA family protein [Pseudomonas sp.]HSX88125.1 GtrA family protein [Pseudomonas sp.]
MKAATNYALLAMIATFCNIGTQDVVSRNYWGPYSLSFSMLLGTAVGLMVKYVLDKRFIFKFKAQNIAHDSRTFLFYALMGVATTVIFWGFELAFAYLFDGAAMRYLGGIIGLAIGYVAKYELDRRFVFNARPA